MNIVFRYIRSMFCFHNYTLEICPFVDVYGNHYSKYVCTKCGKQYIVNPNNKQ